MSDLLCNYPPIDHGVDNNRIIMALIRSKFARIDPVLGAVINWDKILSDELVSKYGVRSIKGIGDKSASILDEWIGKVRPASIRFYAPE